jgi:hypothetical protein
MAVAKQITLRESFRYARPPVDHSSDDYVMIPKDSGGSTDHTIPPKIWIAYPVENYITRADIELEHDQPRLEAFLPVTEVPFTICNEADVVRAATLYILHPINEALNSRYENKIYCRSEIRQPSGVRSGVSSGVTWQFWDSTSAQYTVIAILLPKDRGVLAWSDCVYALQEQSNCTEAIEAACSTSANTAFTGNMVPIAKQAVRYAWSTGTHYAAVFDWDSLFMFRYHELDPDEPSVGDWTQGTWVREEGETTFRKALLGFLLEACKARI